MEKFTISFFAVVGFFSLLYAVIRGSIKVFDVFQKVGNHDLRLEGHRNGLDNINRRLSQIDRDINALQGIKKQ